MSATSKKVAQAKRQPTPQSCAVDLAVSKSLCPFPNAAPGPPAAAKPAFTLERDHPERRATHCWKSGGRQQQIRRLFLSQLLPQAPLPAAGRGHGGGAAAPGASSASPDFLRLLKLPFNFPRAGVPQRCSASCSAAPWGAPAEGNRER